MAIESECPLCHRWFPSIAALEAHLRNTYVCPRCEESFHVREQLDKHLEKRHAGYDWPIF